MPRGRLLAAVASAVLVTALNGCTSHARRIAPPPAAPAHTTVDGLHVTLLWSAPVDLDLYVTDPRSVTLYFANTPTPSGGQLLGDARCDAQASGRGGRTGDTPSQDRSERAGFADPPPGVYRVGVDYIDTCGAARGPVAYRLVADTATGRHETTGVVAPEEFQPIALELTVAPPDAAGSGGSRATRGGDLP